MSGRAFGSLLLFDLTAAALVLAIVVAPVFIVPAALGVLGVAVEFGRGA